MAKKTKAKRSAADRYKTQVQAESTLKFGPEDASLSAALTEAGKQYQGDVAVAHGTRAAIEQAAKTAKPEFAKTYKTAKRAVSGTETSLAADLQKLPAAGAIAGASARDAEGTKRRLAEALAANQSETTARARDAAGGEGYAVQNARSRLADARDKVTARRESLAQEKGAFAQGRSGQLVEDARGRSVTRRGQDKTSATARAQRRTANKNADATRQETHRHNVQVEKTAKKNAEKKNAPKPASAADTEKFKTALTRVQSQIGRVRSEVSNKDKAAGKTERARPETAAIVVNGRKGQTIKNDPKTGDPLPNPIVIPDVKASDQLVTSVALDIAYDGHVSTRNLQLLHKMGLSVKDLGLPTAGRSGTRGAAKPVSPVPKPKKPARGKTNPLTGTTLGGLPA